MTLDDASGAGPSQYMNTGDTGASRNELEEANGKELEALYTSSV